MAGDGKQEKCEDSELEPAIRKAKPKMDQVSGVIGEVGRWQLEKILIVFLAAAPGTFKVILVVGMLPSVNTLRALSYFPRGLHHSKTKVLVRQGSRRGRAGAAPALDRPVQRDRHHGGVAREHLLRQEGDGLLCARVCGLRVRPQLLGVDHGDGVGPGVREELAQDAGQDAVRLTLRDPVSIFLLQTLHWLRPRVLLLRAGVGQVRPEDRHLGQLNHHDGLRPDHLLRPLVPGLRLHLVGHRHHGDRLLHRRLRLDHGDSGREVEGGNISI